MTDIAITSSSRPLAYSYIRFSTPEQAAGDSLRRQTKLAVDYAARHDLDLVDVSFLDLGVSAYRGANAETGRLGEFIEAVRSEAIPRGSWLLIESMDRLSRAKARRAVRLLENICEEGITVVTLSDGRVYTEQALDDDPMAFMWAFMVAMRANEESRTKALRLKKAWEGKRNDAMETGRIQTTRVPSWLEVRGTRQRRFEVVEEKANVVRRIFDLTLNGRGQHAISEMLNREGVPPFGRGKYWHRTFVRKLLSSEAVVGTYIPHTIEEVDGKKVRRPAERIEGYYPSIVDEEIFHAAQTLLATKAPRGRYSGQRKIRNLLGGLATCPCCGGTMTLVNKGARARPKLVCSTAKAGGGCTYHSVDYPRAEEAMLSTWHEWALLELDAQINSPHVAELEHVRRQIEGLDDTLASVFAEIGGRGAGPATAARIRELEAELTDLQDKEEKLGKLLAAASPAIVEARLGRLQEALQAESLDRGRVNALLRQCLSKAVIDYPNRELVLHWHHGPVTNTTLDLTAAFR